MQIQEKLKNIINAQVNSAFPQDLLEQCAQYVMENSFAEGSVPSWEAFERTVGDMLNVPMFQSMNIFPLVNNFLFQNAPQAWFKPTFMTKQERFDAGMNF